jgi:hypothetical protein
MATTDSAALAHEAAKQAGQECLAAALLYLGFGWAPLPLCPPDHVGVGRRHGKTCKQPGKRPVIYWDEFQSRLPTEAEVRGWWKQNPLCNVGVVLGDISGLISVDVDGSAGEQKLLLVSGGEVPPTLEFSTSSGRRHLLYRIPKNVQVKTTVFREGDKSELRFQANGAQTVMPPSRHASGVRYAWFPGRGVEA